MIIIVKRGATREQITEMVGKITSMGLKAHSVEGQQQYTISVLGKTEKVDMNEFSSIDYVESVFRVSKPLSLLRERQTLKALITRMIFGGFSNIW